MTNVFMSYAYADRVFAKNLADGLRDKGMEIWVADHLGKVAGSSWAKYIREALTGADVVLIVLSDAALNSSHVMFELGAADALGKKIVAVHADDRRLPYPLPAPLSYQQILSGADKTGAQLAESLSSQFAP